MSTRDAVPAAPTLEMVAARAGVSRATVSRVVNGSPRVSPEVASAVQSAIEALDYVPNRAARSLVSRRTQAVALLMPESTAKVFADPYFASVVQGVALCLAGTEYTMTLLVESEVQSAKTRRFLLSGNVDGALVVSHHVGDHSYLGLTGRLPVVMGGRPLAAVRGVRHVVDVDNVAASGTAVEHLVQRGRRRLATIAGPQDMPPGLDRLDGWRRAVARHGLAGDLVELGDFTPASGAAAMTRLLERDGRLDGVFAANDQMAIGAYSALAAAGRRVPEDVAVVGFDDDRFAATAHPPLTTVHQPLVEMGTTMAQVLLRLLAGEDVGERTVLETELVVRRSTAGG